MEQHRHAAGSDLDAQLRQAVGALDLHHRFERVERREAHAPRGGSARGDERLDARGKVVRRLVRVEQRQHSRVCRGVAEARERRLQQRRKDSPIESADATLPIERAHRVARCRAVAILVGDGGADPHQRRHLQRHRRRARHPASQSAPRALRKDVASGLPPLQVRGVL
eukprot:4370436-Prymnesium_polylepis.1